MARRVAKLECRKCGERFERAPGVRGRPALDCPRCRRSEPTSKRNPASNRERAEKMRARKKKAKRAAAARPPVEIGAAARLAWGLSTFPDDVAAAARIVGLDVPAADLDALAQLARERFGGIVAGTEDAGRTIQRTIGVLASVISTAADLISPRDMPHALKALAAADALQRAHRGPAAPTQIELVFASSGGSEDGREQRDAGALSARASGGGGDPGRGG